MNRTLLKAIILLPGMVLGFIPAVILFVTRNTPIAAQLATSTEVWFWSGLLLLLAGVALAVWSVQAMLQEGDGTPAPWAPPQKLVVRGPYRFMRNPMIGGALLALVGLTLLFKSLGLAVWFLVFLLFNLVYFPLVEERELAERFGEEYNEYKDHVPRWMPSNKGWGPMD